MINPNWQLLDLDPLTWRNIGRFFNPAQYIQAGKPGEHALFVLHDQGRRLKIVDTKRGTLRELPGLPTTIDNPGQLAESLYKRGEWERVHIINKQHLAAVACLAQSTPLGDLDLDGYYRLVYQLLWDNPTGYVTLPPKSNNWQGWTYSALLEFVERLPPAATLGLGVLNEAGGSIEIGLLLQFQDKRINYVTTFEAFGLDRLSLSEECLQQIWELIPTKLAAPAGLLLCTAPAFEAWIAAPDKAAYLAQAAGTGQAIWRFTPARSDLATLAGLTAS